MIINVLKVFDLVISLAPESTQSNANVIALAMWRTAFGGVNDFGTGSAIAVFLFLLVVPVLLLNIRRFRSGEQVMAVAAPAAIADRRRPKVAGDASPRRSCAALAQGAGAHRAGRARPALARADDRPLRHLDPARAALAVEGLVADLLEAEPRHLVELPRALPQPRA